MGEGVFMFLSKRFLFLELLLLLCCSISAETFDAAVFQARYTTVMEASKKDMRQAVDYLNGILQYDPQNPEALSTKGVSWRK